MEQRFLLMGVVCSLVLFIYAGVEDNKVVLSPDTPLKNSQISADESVQATLIAAKVIHKENKKEYSEKNLYEEITSNISLPKKKRIVRFDFSEKTLIPLVVLEYDSSELSEKELRAAFIKKFNALTPEEKKEIMHYGIFNDRETGRLRTEFSRLTDEQRQAFFSNENKEGYFQTQEII